MVRGPGNIAVFNRALMRLCHRFLINLPRQQPPLQPLLPSATAAVTTLFCIYSVVFQSISAQPCHLFVDKGSWLVNILRPAENTVRSKRSRWMSWISEMKRVKGYLYDERRKNIKSINRLTKGHLLYIQIISQALSSQCNQVVITSGLQGQATLISGVTGQVDSWRWTHFSSHKGPFVHKALQRGMKVWL